MGRLQMKCPQLTPLSKRDKEWIHPHGTILLLCTAIALVGACHEPGPGSPPLSAPATTIAWQPDGNGFVQYSTNDPTKLDSSSYYWDNRTNQALLGDSWTVAVTMIKVSGAIDCGAGIIIVGSTADDLVRILLAWNGSYRIDQKYWGKYLSLQDWSNTGAITQGLGSPNTVSVTTNDRHSYAVYINSTFVASFEWPFSVFPVWAGFYASIGSSSAESFPDVPVDLRFKMTSPISVPP
jgi:hypothetical protein